MSIRRAPEWRFMGLRPAYVRAGERRCGVVFAGWMLTWL
jgi:hypothetical protein